MLFSIIQLLSLVLCLQSGAWTRTTDPALAPTELAREFRAVWVASVANIDWPSKRGLPVSQLRAEMSRILDAAASANLNAIVLQVRPACDALYPSTIEPWSEFLTGQSGKPPEGSYDPLEEWTREAHVRGMELHAWINPFRARHFESKLPDAATHVSHTHPEWVKSHDKYLWLDPGEEGAREHSLAVVSDIVGRYDVDGVHFDDYFYPYPVPKLDFADDASFNRARAANAAIDRAEWRRANIDLFVSQLYQRVKRQKPWVKVGISPFGIYRPGMPPQAQGFDSYAGLYADARKWLREGWLDYASPQLYWKLDSKGQPFARLLDWWVDQNDQGRHIWPGLYASRVLPSGEGEQRQGAPASKSWEPGDIIGQVEATRAARAGGNVHFSAVALVENRRGLTDALRNGPYAQAALMPASPWLRPKVAGEPEPEAPAITVRDDNSGTVVTLPEIKDARWWVLFSKRGGQWSSRVIARDSIGLGIPTKGTREVTLYYGSGDRAIQGVAAQWLDAAGVASPITTFSR